MTAADFSPVRDFSLDLGGRRLGVALFGPEDGLPVIYQHGLPGSRIEAGLVAEAAGRIGLRLIAIDRPGYGASDPSPERSLISWADDVAAAADHIELDRFALLGVSGGALYALAAAAGLADRVMAVGIVCGLGPMALPQLFSLMPVPARLVFTAMRLAAPAAIPLLKKLVGPLLRRFPELVFRLLAPVMPASDRHVLHRKDVRAVMKNVIREAFARDCCGPVQDLALLGGPLGFDLRDVAAPVVLWHGDADRTVPLGHGQWLAEHLPDARLEVLAGEGHFSLPVCRGDRVLEDLKGMMEADR